jgi:hypothetical protein
MGQQSCISWTTSKNILLLPGSKDRSRVSLCQHRIVYFFPRTIVAMPGFQTLAIGLALWPCVVSSLPSRTRPEATGIDDLFLDKRSQPACPGNTAVDRSLWCEYSTGTNYYTDGPDTGVTREYWLELTNITAAPDGVERVVLAVNGTIPGPTLEANWLFRLGSSNCYDSLLTFG